jgi:acetyl/propionyl-CoA carboxylase alpha subunit
MRYLVSLDPEGPPLPVDVRALPEGRVDVRVNARLVDVESVRVGGGASVRVGARIFEVTLHGGDVLVRSGGRRWSAKAIDARDASLPVGPGVGAGHGRRETVVRSPMAGRVVRVLVAAGDVVPAGRGVVVLEAMKMENEVRSTGAGTVAHVHVTAGATVDAHAALVTFATEVP